MAQNKPKDLTPKEEFSDKEIINADVDNLDIRGIRVKKDTGFRGIVIVNCGIHGTDSALGDNWLRAWFTADRDYEFIQAIERHQQKSSDDPVTLSVVRVASGVTVSSGTSLSPDTFDLSLNSATFANQTIKGYTDRKKNLLPKGSSLGLKIDIPSANLRGVSVTIYLRAL